MNKSGGREKGSKCISGSLRVNKGNRERERERLAGMIMIHEEWGGIRKKRGGDRGVTDEGTAGLKGNRRVKSEDKMTKQIYKQSPLPPSSFLILS